MVRFIIGAAGSGKTERVLELMRETYEKTDKRAILLVPEQQTVVFETLLAERFPPEAALRVEAMSFTRLANYVARKKGGLSGASVTPGAKALITWRAIASVWDSLSIISSDARGAKAQLVPRISSAREELKKNSVSAADVEEALDKARENGDGDDPAIVKLHDLFLVSSAYDSIVREELGENYTETFTSDTVRRGAAEGVFDGTDIYIDSFYSLTKDELRVAEELIRAADVTVTVSVGDVSSPLPHEIPPKNLYDRLKRFAGNVTKTVTESPGTNKRASTKELFDVSARLFDYAGTADADSGLPSVPDSVRVFSVRDRYEEAEAAASLIESIVRRGGRYSDIAVIAGDLGALDGVVENCFDRHSIPCFRTDPTPLESGPLARHFISLLKIAGAWRREDVIRLVKTGLTPLTDEEACSFELYTEVWNVRGRRMFSSPWSMNPAGYSKTKRDADKALLAAANDARDKIIPPIEAFVSVFDDGDADVSVICKALMRYAEQIGLYSALTARSRALFAAGDKDGAAREIGTFRKFCDCFDEIVKYLPGVKCDAEGFSALLRFAMTDAGAGAIPTGVDEIALGSAATVRTGAVRHVILLGCVEGEFPGSGSDSGFFNDVEKVTLEGAGITLLPGSEEKDAMELLRFHRSASLPSDSLTLFVPSSSFGEDCTPSIGAQRVLALTGENDPVPFSSLPVEKRLFSPSGTDAAIRSASLCGNVEEEKLLRGFAGGGFAFVPAPPEKARVTAETACKVFGGNIILSQTKLTGYAKCPFSYYVNHVLKLGDRQKADISPLDRGNFVHNVLEGFFSRVKKEELPLGRERTEEICDGIIAEYLDEIFGGGPISEKIRYLFVSLRRSAILFVEAVQREMAQSRFEIFSTELGFGFKGMPESMKVALPDGSFVAFNGKIDRLDVYRSGRKTYVRVVDYKTGEKKFDLEKIMKGIEAQLLIYLFSVWHTEDGGLKEKLGGDEIIPAGALYFYIPYGAKKEDGFRNREQGEKIALGETKRDGIYLADDDVLDAMDKGRSGVYVPIPAGRSKKKTEESFKTLEEFGELCQQLEEAVAAIAGRMKSGDCGASPDLDGGESPCNWCAGAKVCRSAVITKRG